MDSVAAAATTATTVATVAVAATQLWQPLAAGNCFVARTFQHLSN